MLRAFVLLLLALAFSGQARAVSPEGATAQVADFGGNGLSFVYGIDTKGGGVDEEWPLHVRMATAGLLDGSLRLTALSVGREVTAVAGGMLAAELRAARLYADDGTAENVLAASLRGARKFLVAISSAWT